MQDIQKPISFRPSPSIRVLLDNEKNANPQRSYREIIELALISYYGNGPGLASLMSTVIERLELLETHAGQSAKQ